MYIVDSTVFLNACKLCVLIHLGAGILVHTGYVDPPWILGMGVNYVYVDSTVFLNACNLCVCWYQWFL